MLEDELTPVITKKSLKLIIKIARSLQKFLGINYVLIFRGIDDKMMIYCPVDDATFVAPILRMAAEKFSENAFEQVIPEETLQ